jgi:hypothetical protein
VYQPGTPRKEWCKTARGHPSGLIRTASKEPDVVVARWFPGGRVFKRMVAIHVLILLMGRELLLDD